MTHNQRLDTALVALGYFASREQARRALLAGDVEINGERSMKPGWPVKMRDTDENTRLFRGQTVLNVTLREKCPYVSRGGYKLAAGLDAFSINPKGMVCVDIGASTGGFTDCLLQRGAKKVYAVDCGHGQLHLSLREDARVINIEKTNARYIDETLCDETPNIITADVSFISLSCILPAMQKIGKIGTYIVVLVKPQFEAGREHLEKGVVRDTAVREATVEKITNEMADVGWTLLGTCESPVTGPAGNHEFLAGAQI